jgi:hypothetical protein
MSKHYHQMTNPPKDHRGRPVFHHEEWPMVQERSRLMYVNGYTYRQAYEKVTGEKLSEVTLFST